MRQAGVLAAAGLISLEKMSTRLGQDHARAKSLFEGLKPVRGLKLDASPSSNMVYFDLLDEVKLSVNQIVDEMKKRGVLVDWAGPRRFRLVTHYWVDDAGDVRLPRGAGGSQQPVCAADSRLPARSVCLWQGHRRRHAAGRLRGPA